MGARAAAACSALVLGITRDQERLKESDVFIQKWIYTQQSHLITAASFFNLRVVACAGEKKGASQLHQECWKPSRKQQSSDQRQGEG